MPDANKVRPADHAENIALFSKRWEHARPIVAALLRRQLQSNEDAADLLQTVAFKSWANWPQLRDQQEAVFVGWVKRIAINELNTHLDRAKRRPALLVQKLSNEIVVQGTASSSAEDSALTQARLATEFLQADSLRRAVQSALNSPKGEGGLDQAEIDLFLARVDQPNRTLDQIKAELGIRHPAQMYSRLLPKLAVHLLLHHPEVFGGIAQITSAFESALLDRSDPLTTEEASVFRRFVLLGDRRFKPQGWRLTLQSGCLNVLRRLDRPWT